MIEITIKNSNTCQLRGDRMTLMKLYNKYRIKHPQAFFITRRMKTWDGYVSYISKSGTFKTGLLEMIYNDIIEMGQEVKLIDSRAPIYYKPIIPNKMGNKVLFDTQKRVLEHILNHSIGKGKNKIPFLICAGDLAVGFGKTLLMTAIHQSFDRKLKSIILLNDTNLFKQFQTEIPELLPDEDIAFIQGRGKKFGNFNVAMVQSLSANLKAYSEELAKIDIVLIDEADVIDNKTYSQVITRLYNSRIRIGVSGTIYMSEAKSKLIHNMNVKCFIGEKVSQVKLIDQIKNKRATPVIVKSITLDIEPYQGKDLSYEAEYSNTITNNELAYQKSFNRMMYNANYNRFPMLIVTKFIDHCEKLYEYYLKETRRRGLSYTIEHVHHKTKDRDKILERFRQGKIDILISTTIISRGQNFPSMVYLQNTASMDSNEKAIQILGRLVRLHKDKSKAYLDDLIFPGHYLSKHGNHRRIYYQKEHLKVIRLLEQKSNTPEGRMYRVHKTIRRKPR